MNSNAQRDLYPEAMDEPADLQALAAARLAAHRSKRAGLEPPVQETPAPQPAISAAAQRVRDAVAARYQQTPSYREYLAAEAERAVQKAQADAEVAARTARAVADVQTQLLAELQQWPERPEPEALSAPPEARDAAPEPPVPLAETPLQVRPFEPLPPVLPPPEPEPVPAWMAEAVEAHHADELQELNEEIAFRLDPEFHEHLLEPQPLQANIIEFPRQLVAAKKARPRLAEGPLRSDAPEPAFGTGASAVEPPPMEQQTSAPSPQLRIFEVEREVEREFAREAEREFEPEAVLAAPEFVTTVFDQPELTEDDLSPEWQRMILDARPEEDEAPSWVPAPVPELPAAMKARLEAQAAGRVELYLAPAELRLMSTVVDGICLSASFLLFAAVAAAVAGQELHRMALPLLGGAAAVLFVLLFAIYQLLFFSLGGSTPGMYYAELVFRTVQDTEPSVAQLRRRVWANLVAAAPLGLGYLWALLDTQGLGWQDRLSGVYLKEF
jgi:uncharacterized RDD family membrane protein YckC